MRIDGIVRHFETSRYPAHLPLYSGHPCFPRGMHATPDTVHMLPHLVLAYVTPSAWILCFFLASSTCAILLRLPDPDRVASSPRSLPRIIGPRGLLPLLNSHDPICSPLLVSAGGSLVLEWPVHCPSLVIDLQALVGRSSFWFSIESPVVPGTEHSTK